jgi:hypothetical protein
MIFQKQYTTYLPLLYKMNDRIYIAIDNSSPVAKKTVQLIEEMPFATVYRELNATTKKAFKEVAGTQYSIEV